MIERFQVTSGDHAVSGIFTVPDAPGQFPCVLLSHGLSLGALLEALPFLMMAGMIYLSKWVPKLAGIIVILVAIAMLVLMRGWMNFDVYIRILMWSLIPIPLILCGLAFIMDRRERTE